MDFDLLQRGDFRRDENDPGKLERYQAEALAHQRVPMEALLGVVCYTRLAQREVEAAIASAGVDLRVFSQPSWYFQ